MKGGFPVQVNVVVNRAELWEAHTALYRSHSAEFPRGHYGGAYCPCSIARALRADEGRTEPEKADVEAHIAAVLGDRYVPPATPVSDREAQG